MGLTLSCRFAVCLCLLSLKFFIYLCLCLSIRLWSFCFSASVNVELVDPVAENCSCQLHGWVNCWLGHLLCHCIGRY